MAGGSEVRARALRRSEIATASGQGQRDVKASGSDPFASVRNEGGRRGASQRSSLANSALTRFQASSADGWWYEPRALQKKP
jgi:hypothetical protein